MGRPLEGANAATAISYARFQGARPWTRAFWLWFPVGLLVALRIAVSIHPVMIGVVLALAAQAVVANRNIRKRAEGEVEPIGVPS